MSKFNGELKKGIKKMKGGDGYSANPFQPIGGMMSYPRYSNNYRPVFNGDLLHNGGAKKGECGCNKKEPSIFNLIKQNGGADITQVSAIGEVGKMITPLSVGGLISVIMVIFLYHYTNKKPRKGVQMGGYTNQLESLLAPLGKNNLLVLASLLLLHHFAVMNSKKKTVMKKGLGNKLKKIQSGGNIINSILTTLFNFNENKNSKNNNSNIIETIDNSFKEENKNNNIQTGGNNLLKSYVQHLGGTSFYANSIFHLLENIFNNKIKEINTNINSDKNKLKNNIIKKNHKLFYILSPISFNIFGSEDTVNKIFNELKKQK